MTRNKPGDLIVCRRDVVYLFRHKRSMCRTNPTLYTVCRPYINTGDVCLIIAICTSTKYVEDDLCVLAPLGQVGWTTEWYFDGLTRA